MINNDLLNRLDWMVNRPRRDNSETVPIAASVVRECIAALSAAKPVDPVEREIEPSCTEFQSRVQPWMLKCFGAEISRDYSERCHRFLEEALELVQAGGTTADEAHQLVDYVYGRPVGELHQEVGGVMVTLAALCLAFGSNMHECGEVELARIWTKIDVIRAKQAAKPKHSPLPAPFAIRAGEKHE
jgi:hypothetical protein